MCLFHIRPVIIPDYYKMSRRPPRPFSFDGAYQGDARSNRPVVTVAPSESGKPGAQKQRTLVPFFSDDQPDTNTDWCSGGAPEEDLREGMDDYQVGEDDDAHNYVSRLRRK